MKRYGTLLQLTTCLALGGTVMVLWLCVLIGFGIHTTVGKEGIYLWLLLQAVQLTARRNARARTSDGTAVLPLRLVRRCGGAAVFPLHGAGRAVLRQRMGQPALHARNGRRLRRLVGTACLPLH